MQNTKMPDKIVQTVIESKDTLREACSEKEGAAKDRVPEKVRSTSDSQQFMSEKESHCRYDMGDLRSRM